MLYKNMSWEEQIDHALENAHWVLKVFQKGDTLQFCPFEHFEYGKDQSKDIAYSCFNESALRICQRQIRLMLQWVQGAGGINLNLHRVVVPGTNFRGYLPLDEKAGTCLALFSELYTGRMLPEMAQLMAWRIANMQSEEAAYLLNKAAIPALGNDRTKNWAKKGLRIMLGGSSSDIEDIRSILARFK